MYSHLVFTTWQAIPFKRKFYALLRLCDTVMEHWPIISSNSTSDLLAMPHPDSSPPENFPSAEMVLIIALYSFYKVNGV